MPLITEVEGGRSPTKAVSSISIWPDAQLSTRTDLLASITDLLNNKEEGISRTTFKISEAHQQIQELKYTLNKLDGELGYFENQNE